MRPPVRAVGDDHVDRPEVERRRRRGRPVLMARGLPAGRGAGAGGAPPPRAGPARSPSPPSLPPSPCLAAVRPRPCRAIGMAATAAGPHLFPSRTEQLSPPAPMVLPAMGGRVGRRHPAPRGPWPAGLFFVPAACSRKRSTALSPVRLGLAFFTFSGGRARAVIAHE